MLAIYGIRLAFRIIVLITAIVNYVNDRSSLIISNELFGDKGISFLQILWAILLLEMLQKLFPQQKMSMGCRKQFGANYLAGRIKLTGAELAEDIKSENTGARKVFALWVGVNAVVGMFYFVKRWGESELVLLSLIYYVGDLFCLLLYCPFQKLFMKNRCCVTCRIFNWDCIMMVTPLIFIRSFFSWSLVAVALVILIHWEIAYRKYPQRFFEDTNDNLKCANCSENLCLIKRSSKVKERFGT